MREMGVKRSNGKMGKMVIHLAPRRKGAKRERNGVPLIRENQCPSVVLKKIRDNSCHSWFKRMDSRFFGMLRTGFAGMTGMNVCGESVLYRNVTKKAQA